MWIKLDFSHWDMVGALAAVGFVFGGPPLTLLAGLLLGVPSWRRHLACRCIGIALLVLVVAVGLRAATTLADEAGRWWSPG